jgi:hypothetical protein
MRIRWRVGTLLAASALLAACGRDKPPDAAPGPVEAKSTANAIVLKPSEVPHGWVAQPAGGQIDQDATWKELLGCLGLGEAQEKVVATAASPTFGLGPQMQIATSVAVVSDNGAEQIATAVAGRKVNDCAAKAFGAELQRNGKAAVVKVGTFVVPQVRQVTLALRGTSTVDAGGAQTSTVLDLVVLLNGNTVTRLMFRSTGGPFPPDLQTSFINRVASRT